MSTNKLSSKLNLLPSPSFPFPFLLTTVYILLLLSIRLLADAFSQSQSPGSDINSIPSGFVALASSLELLCRAELALLALLPSTSYLTQFSLMPN